MVDRELKAIFTALLGLMALLYVTHNIMNLATAYGAVEAVTSLENNAVFTVNLLPPLTGGLSQVLAWIIFLFEILTALTLFVGATSLWRHRRSDPAEYASALRKAKLGAGLAVFVWFGLFGVMGGAGYQMWQHEVGSGSLSDAFKFSVWGFLLLIYLGQPEKAPEA